MSVTSSTPPRRAAARLLPIPAIAEQLDVSIKTVRRLIRDQRLIAHRIGRSLRVSEDDLRLFLSQHRG
jgi:excisionase family DNA binding protein